MFKFLKNFCFLSLMILFCVSGIAEAKTVRFAILSDIHYSTDKDTVGHSARNWSKTQKLLDSAIDTVNIADIDFVVFLGDNIDSSKEDFLISFLKKIKRLNKPYYICLGNHDAYKISGISKDRYSELVNKYTKYKKYDGFNYTFSISPEILGVVVDGSFPVAPSSHGVITKKTMTWLDHVLKDNSDKKVIIFQHFPVKEPCEKKNHTIVNKDLYQQMLKRHSNIIAICSGHYHDEKVIHAKDGIYHISAPSLSESNKYQAVKIKYNSRPSDKFSDMEIDVFSINFIDETPHIEEDEQTESTDDRPAESVDENESEEK